VVKTDGAITLDLETKAACPSGYYHKETWEGTNPNHTVINMNIRTPYGSRQVWTEERLTGEFASTSNSRMAPGSATAAELPFRQDVNFCLGKRDKTSEFYVDGHFGTLSRSGNTVTVSPSTITANASLGAYTKGAISIPYSSSTSWGNRTTNTIGKGALLTLGQFSGHYTDGVYRHANAGYVHTGMWDQADSDVTRVHSVLANCGLDEATSTYASTLYGGNRQLFTLGINAGAPLYTHAGVPYFRVPMHSYTATEHTTGDSHVSDGNECRIVVANYAYDAFCGPATALLMPGNGPLDACNSGLLLTYGQPMSADSATAGEFWRSFKNVWGLEEYHIHQGGSNLVRWTSSDIHLVPWTGDTNRPITSGGLPLTMVGPSSIGLIE